MEKRHYEILLILRPSEDAKITGLVDKYISLLKKDGEIERMEKWGLRRFAYAIKDHKQGFYVLINAFCPAPAIEKLEELFRFEETLLRFLIMRCRKAHTDESPVMLAKKKQVEERPGFSRKTEQAAAPSGSTRPARAERDWSGENVDPDAAPDAKPKAAPEKDADPGESPDNPPSIEKVDSSADVVKNEDEVKAESVESTDESAPKTTGDDAADEALNKDQQNEEKDK